MVTSSVSRSRLFFITTAAIYAIFLIPVSHASPYRDGPPELTLNNIATVEEAELYAKQVIERYKDLPIKERKFAFIHVGKELPKPLKWFLIHLYEADFTITGKLLTQDELETELKQQQAASQKIIEESLTYDADMPSSEAKQLADNARTELEKISYQTGLALRQIFAMANGFTLNIELKREAQDVVAEAKVAGRQAAIAGASVAASLYYKIGEIEPGIVFPVIGVAGWVFLNLQNPRWVTEFMGQGRNIKLIKDKSTGEITVKFERHPLAVKLITYIRSVVISGIVGLSAHYAMPDLVGLPPLAVVLSNAGFTMFSRAWFEELIGRRQPRTLSSGEVVSGEKGKFSSKTIRRLREGFEIFNGLAKNGHLFSIPVVKYAFPIMAAYGIIEASIKGTIWTGKKAIGGARWALRKIKVLPPARVEACQTVLLLPEPPIKLIED